MLATKFAQSLYERNNMTSALQHRAHTNGSFTSSSSESYMSDLTIGSQKMLSPHNSTEQRQNGIQRDDNIMNRRADMNNSLYQTCLGLKKRLAQVPGFAQHLAEIEEDEAENEDSTDPVDSIWSCFKRGYPLMTIYNALQHGTPLKVDASKIGEAKIGKAATFKFLQACLTELMFPSNECFLITDLYGSDTTGFVKVSRWLKNIPFLCGLEDEKVIKVVNRVLDLLSQKGLLLHTELKSTHRDDGPKPQNLTYRQNVVNELVVTERDYVQHLETLQQFKNEIEESGAIVGDAVHDIFLNLNALLDFQRRFLIRIEQQNSLPEAQQNWGELFVNNKEYFRVYEPFIANQTRCNETLMKDWDKLKAAPLSPALDGLLNTQHILAGFLLKPFQRLSKYPMLLRDLRLRGALDEERKADLFAGECAAGAILDRANEALGMEHRRTAWTELQGRIEDWKGINTETLGDLLLYGTYDVIKFENGKEAPREFKVYLFETFLLCCKEPKNKMLGTNKPLTDKKGKLRLHLKGRISLQNVTDVLSLASPEKPSYTLQIFWKGDSGVESFIIRFGNEELLRKWRVTVSNQQNLLTEAARKSGQEGTSKTEFLSMKNAYLVENPYLQDDDVDEDDSQGSTLVEGQDLGASRNASSTSLRAAAATLASGSILPAERGTSRMAPRYPQKEFYNTPYPHNLTLHTNVSPKMDSPGEFPGNSHFSPTADSPMSSRSSAQNYFPRQLNPINSWPTDENKHKTAPATSRAPSREGPGQLGSYNMNSRTIQRPSLPVMAASSQNAQQAMTQSRLRSVSTPDIHNSSGSGSRRYVNGQQPSVDNTPVPPLPSYMASMRAPVNRSQANSPINAQIPVRSATQSPQLQRDSHSQQQRYQLQHAEAMYRANQQNSLSGIPQQIVRSSPLPVIAVPDAGIPYPTQLKVKIWFEPSPSHVTIVVPIIIKHRSLVDRIDSKMVRISSASISNGTARLRYKDQEGDILTIGSDEDVSLAIEDWAMGHLTQLHEGIVSDFELYWHEN